MLTKEITEILAASEKRGWVLEPEAKRLLSAAGLATPRFELVTSPEEAVRSAREIGYPVVCKIVSYEVMHKSDRHGVAVGIHEDRRVADTFARFSRIEGFIGMLVEEMLSGVELIVGAKVDYQFGPVILLGMGGTGVEIYGDVVLRMAPIAEKDVEGMIRGLKAHRILEGYRGSEGVDVQGLVSLVKAFSDVVMDLRERIESIDLNPVICASTRCTVADARIILKTSSPSKTGSPGS